MTPPHEADVVVIGAGPAGIGAALEAARAGAKVRVIDGYSAAGGQYWMQPASHFQSNGTQEKEGAARVNQLTELGVVLHNQAEVWGVLPGWRVLARGPGDEALELRGKVLVIGTGAHDRVYPFPGWTLPGVMTAGGGQRFAKLSGRSPGGRVVVAGSGIFLWAVAASVLKMGGHLVAMVEAQKNRVAMLGLLAQYPEKWSEAARLLAPVLRARTPLLSGQVVKAAKGDGRLEAIAVGPLESGGAMKGPDRDVEADCLLVSHGFRPLVEITALLGCEHDYDPEKGGWYCKAEAETGTTSVEGIFAAGEVTGIAGSRPGFLRGSLAGLAAAEYIGCSPSNLRKRRRRLSRDLVRAQAFATELGRLFKPPPGLTSLVRPETLVCRCEEVAWQDVRAAWLDGADSLYGIKLWSRAGMGRCQGRICGDSLAALLADEFSVKEDQIGFNRPRLPLRPVPLTLASNALSGSDTNTSQPE
ncbi:MAG: NAD(P)/FAD-dependent oxidoreductase [Gammaproteobacteria bacterium]|nr:NAD(P)/FAD-dependent oxidoreductase [Gammaproteobacteria bacterium]